MSGTRDLNKFSQPLSEEELLCPLYRWRNQGSVGTWGVLSDPSDESFTLLGALGSPDPRGTLQLLTPGFPAGVRLTKEAQLQVTVGGGGERAGNLAAFPPPLPLATTIPAELTLSSATQHLLELVTDFSSPSPST